MHYYYWLTIEAIIKNHMLYHFEVNGLLADH